MLSEDTPGTDHDNEEHVNNGLPVSHSSTIAGKVLFPKNSIGMQL